VTLRIYDANGRLVREWNERQFQAGEHTIIWDGRDQLGRAVASGVYFSELRFGQTRRVARMALVR